MTSYITVYVLYFETQTIIMFTLLEITCKGHSWSSAMPSFVRSPEVVSIRDQKTRLHIFSDKNSRNYLEGRSRSMATANFNRPHIAL